MTQRPTEDLDSGQSLGNVTLETRTNGRRQKRAEDDKSAVRVPGWPRLLNRAQSASYLNLSVWTFDEIVNAGSIEPVRVPRPDTAKQRRRQHVNADALRRLLFDVRDLDRLVEQWKVSA